MIFRMPRFPCALCLSVMVGTLTLQAKAQTCGANAQSPIATDRPQITSSSIVVPCGSLQFENGFQETSNGGQPIFDFPETSVRFGIAGKTELRLAVPDYFYNDDTASGFANGFGDLSLGFKQQLGPTRGGFEVSLIPSVSFPTGANLISSHSYDPTVQLPWSRSLTKNWTAAGMFSLMWPTEGAQRNLTGRIQAFAASATGLSLRLWSFGRNARSLDRLWLFCSLPGDSIQVTEQGLRSVCRSCRRRPELQVPGNIDDHNALIPAYKKKQLQQLSPLVVKRSLPPVFDDELGDEDGDLTIRMVALDLQDVLDERHDDEAVG
jgi:hypothetical protein